MREHEQGVEVAVVRGGIKRGSHGRFGISWELEGDRTHNRFLYHCHSDELDSLSMVTHTLSVRTHGRYLVDIPEHSRATLVGFHGYKENASIQMGVLRRIAGDRSLGLISIQALHRFYSRGSEVVASWMTKEDRELAITDNVEYVGHVLTAIADEFGVTRPLIYVGFSQGVAMAYRTAALVQRPSDAIIALAGDLPPDVAPLAASLPRILIGRGTEEEWYTADKAAKDLDLLRSAGVNVDEHVFEGGHLWTPAFVEKSAAFIDELLSA
jgi:predicted esterase